ncbi:MAG: Glu-tRNA(Gln) amidotransferase subunit GatD [Candidatus Aenigmarchaeota archaeon]|nr:Glu-tRNA(Gln) amidotransferase subunit GatD [Candidatus Aenigmarchaeota archaeon]MDI6722202.1 Glu-tRNA(Gln) amidotransferase subunit GatD [Candidatus Aenigmarchaeota archaeon]
MENYSPQIQKALKGRGMKTGDLIGIQREKDYYEGMLMPRFESGDANCIVLKLDNGYNIGIEFTKATRLKKISRPSRSKEPVRLEKYKPEAGKKNIVIFHTGGTIASRIDYETGGVISSVSPEELLLSVPELAPIANIRTKMLFQISSEDVEHTHWSLLAQRIFEEVIKGADGIIVTHGTDTMHYTSAALSFMLQNVPIPVLLVGSQRSSDRGSSDAALNLICAANFLVKTDFAGVGICMHGSTNDDFCYVHEGTHVRKMHTSRRDAFRSIDALPIAKVTNGHVEYLREYRKKGDKPFVLKNKFESKVALVKTHPGFFNCKVLEFFEKEKYKGIVLEGTGLGHAPVTAFDDFTKHHPKLLSVIKRLTDSGMIVLMASQCPYGIVNMNVYSIGRNLQKAGVMPAEMTAECAYVKLGWALGNTKDALEAERLLKENIVEEVPERIDPSAFLL